ncbi:MAG: dihydropteroate synthase [Deltaproteobacteria bacterium]|uniref:Dihydropteroate synthase n=1 Tax=Candidatus Zymogenus saltonus TaxID=2844893 RepID=A0A9D8KAM6_9DELT|nr:dihydropteroate synthase [Candidatus Zymogenus saltonus]
MIIVAERINATRKSIRQALENKDEALIAKEAKDQFEAGADFIDLNAGANLETEVQDLHWMVDIVESVVEDARISLDSSSSEVILKSVNKVKNTPMINSVSLESKKFEEMRPAIEARESDIIALSLDDRGLPKNSAQAFDNAERIVEALEKLGVKRERIFVDPLLEAISVDNNNGLKALDTIRKIHENIEGVNIICGLSNISYGLPERYLVNRTFLAVAISHGLNAAIADPLDQRLMTTAVVAEMLVGKDRHSRKYLTKFRNKEIFV